MQRNTLYTLAEHNHPGVLQGLLALSEGQLRDFLALRHLFLAKLGRLSLARQALLQQLANAHQLPKLRALAGQLQLNVIDEQRAYLTMLTACCLGVSVRYACVVRDPRLPSCKDQPQCLSTPETRPCARVLRHYLQKFSVCLTRCMACCNSLLSAMLLPMLLPSWLEVKPHGPAVQIPSPTQAAVSMVSSYPSLLYLPFLEKLGQRFDEPSLSDIMLQAPGCNHPLSWKHVAAYVEAITVTNMFTSMPFLPRSRQQQLCSIQSACDSRH